jgi:uncharacterized protein
MSFITEALVQFARQRFILDWHGHHGVSHWARVRLNGLALAQHTGANRKVVEYFAFIHDLGRENEYSDPHHGLRAADIATQIAGDLIDVTEEELCLLQDACRGHSDGHMAGDVTVITCWDADRLDLGRVGIQPDPERLCTTAARDPAMLIQAYQRSIR